MGKQLIFKQSNYFFIFVCLLLASLKISNLNITPCENAPTFYEASDRPFSIGAIFMSKRLTIGEVIRRFKKSHKNKYDYSLVVYKNCDFKVKIICPIHGIFEQTPYKHFYQGCPSCSGRKKITKEIFIERSIRVHGNKYNYSLINEIINSDLKVSIICPAHGIFKQSPFCHYGSRQGCPKCSGRAKLTIQEFVERSSKVHNGKYDYSLVRYINNRTLLSIICPVHGMFMQKGNDHLRGIGCKECGYLETSKKQRSNASNFITKAKRLHGDLYDYSKIVYQNTNTKVVIICKKHGEFNQAPYSHLSGRGCPFCKSSKGIALIEKFLKEKNINYAKEHKFKDCINPRTGEKFLYDIFIPSLNMLIEFDGEQHFKSRFWEGKFGKIKGRKELKYQQYKDRLKDRYAKKNNLFLLRISYLQASNINNILEDNITYENENKRILPAQEQHQERV